MIRYFLIFAFTFTVLLPVHAQADMTDTEVAVLRGLDKVSGRKQDFEMKIGQTVRFGQNLYIRVRACRKSDPIETPESAAFLEVWEKDLKSDESSWVFSGWMFASSPALSAMDHPVYDVWIIDCKNDSTNVPELEKETTGPGILPESAEKDAKVSTGKTRAEDKSDGTN